MDLDKKEKLTDIGFLVFIGPDKNLDWTEFNGWFFSDIRLIDTYQSTSDTKLSPSPLVNKVKTALFYG